jgi:hypothetical protein
MPKPIAENRSKPKSGWGRDIGSRPGRADFRNHACNGSADDFQSRPWGGDKGNIVAGPGESKPLVMKGQLDRPWNHPKSA